MSLTRKSFCGALAALLILVCLPAIAADVTPASVPVDFIRGTAPTIDGTFWEETTLRIEYQAFSDTAGIVTQDLTAVTEEFRIGLSATNVPYTPTVTNAPAGQGYVDITVPGTNFPGSIIVQYQITGTNGGGTVFTYPWGFLSTAVPLQ